MSRDGCYGTDHDQSATSAQGLENTIRARWWVESVPGPLKRRQEKRSCPLLSGPGTHQERLLARFFFRDGNIDKAFVRPAVQWRVSVDRAYNEKEVSHMSRDDFYGIDQSATSA